jgi:glutamyl-Q tRNA(Asp) synthetase
MIVTRFAPSPTGFLHLGHAFAAITAHDSAKRAQGRFVVRIEDIDGPRCRSEFEAAIAEDLHWLGLEFEEPVRRQSEHPVDYEAAIKTLAARGLLYPCFCTRKDIAAEIARAGSAPHGPDGPSYPGTCRDLSLPERDDRLARGAPYALRLDVGKAKAAAAASLSFEEEGAGPLGETGTQIIRADLLSDIVLARKGLQTSYHLAVVVDDALQGVTLVTRGNDLYHATHIQRLLQACLGLEPPRYGHHRLILDAKGRKFSKRDTAVTLASLRQNGVSVHEIRRLIGI